MDAEQQKQPAVNLKLCLYGGKEATVERSFDTTTTTLHDIQHEMRKLFNIETERETKLWINSSVYFFKSDKTTATTTATSSDNGKNNTGATAQAADVVDSSSEAKENNNCSPASKHISNGTITSNNNIKANNASPTRLPPTPPPMPANTPPPSSSSSSSSSSASPATASSSQAGNSTPSSIVTRQAAQSMGAKSLPIALPDVKKRPNDEILQAWDDYFHNGADNPTHSQTLSEAGVSDSAVVTLEVVNTDGTWPSSRPRFGHTSTRSSKAQPGLCGLSNMGNTCFMNSALQCLSNTPQLTDYILTNKFVDDINTNNPLGMHGEIARTYAELIKVMWSGNHSSFLPREFKCAVSRFAPQFTGFAQQDCQELMAFLLDGLHEDLNRIKNKPYIEIKSETEKRPDEEVAKESWENYKKRNDSIVVDTFHAMLKSTLVCPECNLVSVTFDPFCYLSLPLPVKREKQVSLTFLPKPAELDQSEIATALKVLDPKQAQLVIQCAGRLSSFDMACGEKAGYANPSSRPKSCKMQVPRSGPASELCEIVARIINEERSADEEKVDPTNLVVAEMGTLIRISKIYESSEHYNQISDDIVVIEKASKYAVPLYLKEESTESGISSISRSSQKLLFLHVPDLKYETLYQSIIVNLSNLTTDCEQDFSSWFPLFAPHSVDHPMEVDEEKECKNVDTGDCNGTKRGETNGISSSHEPAFSLATENSYGNNSFDILGPNSKECDSSKLYLGATFKSEVVATRQQFQHIREAKKESVDIFTPKVSPKPTLQLKDCITQFTNAERLGADDPWYCPKCKKHQQAIKKFDVWSLPKVLIIHLKRFSFSRSWRDKIDTLVEFPVEGLDMSSYVHNPEQKKQEPIIYDLIGVANHFGGLGGGHYTAYAKNAPLNAWYSFDDALVCPTNAAVVVTRSAYVLFYQLRE